jgi:tripartite-type tricarboxylate transporter receptor subunit TctC
MLSRRRFLSAAASVGIAAPALRLAAPAAAQTIAGPARMLVGFAPGGLVDAAARLIVEPLKGYAPSLVVDNRGGAGGRLALETLKSGEPNGSVMALAPIDQLVLYPHIYTRLSYRPVEDFAPVAGVCSFQFLLVVGAKVPAEPSMSRRDLAHTAARATRSGGCSLRRYPPGVMPASRRNRRRNEAVSSYPTSRATASTGAEPVSRSCLASSMRSAWM